MKGISCLLNVGFYPFGLCFLFLFGTPSSTVIRTDDAVKRVSFTYTFVAGSKVSTNGDTNVKPFSCVYLYNQMSPVSKAVLIMEGNRQKIQFRNTILIIPARSMECGHKGMNSDLSKALKADRFPNISINLKEADALRSGVINLSDPTGFNVRAELSVAGVTRTVSLVSQGQDIGNNTYHFTGEYSLAMSDYGITPPVALFGMIKVRDNLKIRFDLKVRVNSVSEEN